MLSSFGCFKADGHWHPETFYLSSIQSREAIYEVLSEVVKREEISEKKAVEIAKGILFDNSNRLYKLSLNPDWKSTSNAGLKREGPHESWRNSESTKNDHAREYNGSSSGSQIDE